MHQMAKNIPFVCKIEKNGLRKHRKLPLHDLSKLTQIYIFGLKICHLATLGPRQGGRWVCSGALVHSGGWTGVRSGTNWCLKIIHFSDSFLICIFEYKTCCFIGFVFRLKLDRINVIFFTLTKTKLRRRRDCVTMHTTTSAKFCYQRSDITCRRYSAPLFNLHPQIEMI
jgi:hypothetical protein